MRRLVLLAPLAAHAHMVSISSGEARLEGSKLFYELRMPLFEISHLKQPGRDLPPQIEFAGARRLKFDCHAEPAENVYVCNAEYVYDEAPEVLKIRSTLHRVTVPNHVHMIRARRGENTDQAVLELSFPEAGLRFRPPTAFELAAQQIIAGVTRAAAGPAQLLFLTAIALAARRRSELIALAAAFAAGQAAAVTLSLGANWSLAPRFLEAAAALTIAYLAVEILFLPDAGHRWAVVGVLGGFHGLAIAAFLTAASQPAPWVLSGVFFAEFTILAFLALAASRWVRGAAVRVFAAVLLIAGLGWFGLRLAS